MQPGQRSSGREAGSVVAHVAAAIGHRRPRVAVLGDVMLDEYLSGSVDRISPEAPIPVVACTARRTSPGGAANVAANLAALGAEAAIIAIAGEDEAAAQLRGALRDMGVDAAHLLTIPGRPTTRKLRVVSAGQQIVRVDFEETGELAATDIAQIRQAVETALAHCDVLVVSDYNKGACHPEALRHAIALARLRGIPVLCDPKGRDYAKYAGATIITPNRREAGEASGRDLVNDGAVEAAAQTLREKLALEACLITLGPDGMLLVEEEGPRKAEAFTQAVADVTGAGDSVIAALALARACGRSNWEAALFANAVAAVAVSRHGSVAVELDDVVSRYGPAADIPSAGKIMTRGQAAARAAELRREGRRITFTNGCFDVLHAGHVDNLEACAGFGSFLVVGLNDDDSVRRLKGPGRPVNNVEARARVLAAMSAVDCVVIFAEDTPEQLIRAIRPDVLAKGADYQSKLVVGRDFVESYGGRVELVGLAPGFSSTDLINKLQRSVS
ncbi:MAG: D-glycero-beta-D-manno-heptose 1-phosphate adenylyltransferase [Pseudomonadota bacterium]